MIENNYIKVKKSDIDNVISTIIAGIIHIVLMVLIVIMYRAIDFTRMNYPSKVLIMFIVMFLLIYILTSMSKEFGLANIARELEKIREEE